MAKSVLPNNGLALCIIIIVVVGLFLHYELGYNLDLFSVGGRRRPNNGHIGHKRHKPWYHPHSWFTHNIYNTHTHPQNISIKKDDLFNQYDSNNDGNIDKGEFSQALEIDLKNKLNDKNTYSFY